MMYTNIYSNIKVYTKYIGTSIKEGCVRCNLYASSGPKTEGVQTNNYRGRGSAPVASAEVYRIHVIRLLFLCRGGFRKITVNRLNGENIPTQACQCSLYCNHFVISCIGYRNDI